MSVGFVPQPKKLTLKTFLVSINIDGISPLIMIEHLITARNIIFWFEKIPDLKYPKYTVIKYYKFIDGEIIVF